MFVQCAALLVFLGRKRYKKSVLVFTHNYPSPHCAHSYLFALGPRIIIGVTLVLTVTTNCEFLS